MYESASQTDNASLVDNVVDLLRSGRTGLVTDIDGTISPIMAQPAEARVLPKARQALKELRGLLALVAVVSGRTAADARKMVGLAGLTYVGNHGFDILSERGPEIFPAARPWVPRLAAALEIAQTQIQQPGILIENKGVTVSLHYRLAPDRERARQALLDILVPIARTSGLLLEEGRMVISLLPPLTISKGSAVCHLVDEHRLNRLVYLGDDTTDTHAFAALEMLRQSFHARTLSIAVVDDETPPSVWQLADASLPSVEAVADLLRQVAERLKSEC